MKTIFFSKQIMIRKPINVAAIFIFLLLLTAGNVRAQFTNPIGLPIAYWDFENNTTRTILETTVEQAANSGCTFDGKIGGASTAVCAGTGNGLYYNAAGTAGTALSAGGWQTSAFTPYNTYYQFTVNTTGFSGVQFMFDTYSASGASYPDVIVFASYDGGANYSLVFTPGVSSATWQSWYVSLPASANNLSNLKIRICGYFSNNSAGCATSGYLKLDNLNFFASALVTNAGIKNTLVETSIYTSYTSGVTGSLWIRYGTLTINSGATLNMTGQIFIGSSTTAGAISVASGGKFDCGSAGTQTLSTVASGLSTFTLSAGATLVVRSTVGIAATGTNTGNIQLTTRSFSGGANYIYTHTAGTAMSTGTGLPASITSGGSVTIDNTNPVTLSQATAFASGSILFLDLGTFTNGALLTMNNGSTINRDIGILNSVPTFSPSVNVIYSGTTAVNTANELPSGASNLGALTINKSGGVTLVASPTVNGATSLTAGSLNIAANTLTLKGAITSTAGTLGGSTASNLIVSGTGTITGNLSFTSGSQQLDDLTNTRSASTLTLGNALSIGGNIVNNATITATAATTFNQAGNATVSGTGTTNFTTVVLAKSAKADEINCTGLITMSTGGLGTIGTGTFKLSSASTIVPFSGTTTVPVTAAYTLNHASAVSNYGTNASMTFNGDLTISNGTMTVGGASGNSLTIGSTGTLTVQAGALNVAGRLVISGGSLTQSGGTITLNKNGNASATATFSATATGNLNITNGTVVFQDVNTSTGNDLVFTNGAGTKTITGGTVQFGNATTGAGLTFKCNSPVAFKNVTINATNTPTLTLVTNNLDVNGILTLNGGNITTGVLKVNIPVGGSVTRTSGHIVGNLQKGFNTGSGQSKTFEVGDATTYAPVLLAALNVTTAGSLTAFTAAGANPSENIPIANSSGINQSTRANRYWTMNESGGFVMSNANATFNFASGEATGSTSSYVVRQYDPSTWATTTVGTRTSTSTQCTGLTSFSEFEAGVPSANPGITCPSDITQCDNHVVSFSPAVTGSPAPDLTCTPASGSTFATGNTAVNCSVTNINGSNNCSFNVTINESPVISACPSDITTCNPVVSFSIPTAAGTPAPSVICSPSSGSTFAPGTTSVTCTATNSCGNSPCSFDVTYNVPSTAASSASSNANYGEICVGSQVTLTATGGSLGTGATWEWYEGGCGTGGSVGTGSSIILTPVAGLHQYFVRAEGACGNTACVSVSVNVITSPPTSTIHYTASIADGCVGAPAATFTVNAVAGCTFYNWSSSQAGVRFNGNASPYQTTVPTVNVSFVSLPAAGASGWSICVFGGNACGNTNTICTWVRATLSTPGSVTGSIIGCPGATGNPYSCASVAGAASYQWSSTGGITITGNGAQAITVDFTGGFVSGTLSVHGQTSCGYNGPDRTITISRAPAIPGIISGPSYPCPNASSVYSVAAVTGANDYTWTTSVPGAIVTGTTNTCSILFPAVIPGGSTVSVTANSVCPFSSPVRSKGVASGIPGVPANISGPASGQCGETGVSYSITPVALATGYNWTTTCGAIQGPNNLSGITVDWPGSFTFCTITVTASNACGAGIARTLNVLAAPATPATVSGNAAPCAGSTELYNASSSGATSYNWTIPAGSVILGPVNGSTIILQWGSTGGSVTVQAVNACGNSGNRSLACGISCRQSQMNETIIGFNAGVYPNPATDKATVKFSTASAGQYQIEVIDVLGQRVLSTEGTAVEGINMIDLDLNNVAKGVYLLNIMSGDQRDQIKLVVE